MKQLLKQQEKTTVHQIIQCLQNWNTDILLSLLDKNKTYQDLSPREFVNTIKFEVRAFKRSRDTKLIVSTDTCHGCNCKEQIYVFKGNNSSREYALYFHVENEEILDIYQCNWYGKTTFDEIDFEGKDNLRVTFL